MVVEGTPLEYYPELGLWVKREDMSCPGGPNFSKTRGVYEHVRNRPEGIIGVLDTAHSQGGWAVARACHELGKGCVLFYPVRKAEQGMPLKAQQAEAKLLGAHLISMKAGRSAVLYQQARRMLDEMPKYPLATAYMMPNALKLPETVSETAAEFRRTDIPGVGVIVVSASSAAIAAGVLRARPLHMRLIVHMGYSRSERAVRDYLHRMSGMDVHSVWVVDEGYGYKDRAKPGPEAPFPCNEYYDLKAFRWWMRVGRPKYGEALFWNVG